MGHYLSEMRSDADWEAERKEKEERLRRRTEKIQQAIDEKGLARFLAEMSVSTYDGTINAW